MFENTSLIHCDYEHFSNSSEINRLICKHSGLFRKAGVYLVVLEFDKYHISKEHSSVYSYHCAH